MFGLLRKIIPVKKLRPDICEKRGCKIEYGGSGAWCTCPSSAVTIYWYCPRCGETLFDGADLPWIDERIPMNFKNMPEEHLKEFMRRTKANTLGEAAAMRTVALHKKIYKTNRL